jgi:hypothetical protein
MDQKIGKILIKFARLALKHHLEGDVFHPQDYPEVLNEKRGVFVTLKKYPENTLRGCIGHPYPDSRLIDSLLDSAISAGVRDPRFPPVSKSELEEIKIEVTVLSPPKMLTCDPEEYASKIELGKHGLIVEAGMSKGLLLPQVPIEWGWDKEEFLAQTCIKAGLPRDAWKSKDTKVYVFEGEVFSELRDDFCSYMLTI